MAPGPGAFDSWRKQVLAGRVWFGAKEACWAEPPPIVAKPENGIGEEKEWAKDGRCVENSFHGKA